MQKIILQLVICLIAISINAQKLDVDFKKDKIIVNDKVVLGFEKKSMGTEFSIYSLEPQSEIIYAKRDYNGTMNYRDDDMVKITFLDLKISIESKALSIRTWKYIVELMFESHLFDENNKLIEENVKKFELKYNEDITNRTVIIKY